MSTELEQQFSFIQISLYYQAVVVAHIRVPSPFLVETVSQFANTTPNRKKISVVRYNL